MPLNVPPVRSCVLCVELRLGVVYCASVLRTAPVYCVLRLGTAYCAFVLCVAPGCTTATICAVC